MRRQACPDEVLAWLGSRIGADIAWVRGPGAAVATAGFPVHVLTALAEPLSKVAGARFAASTAYLDGREVRLEGFGPHEPRRVLVTLSATSLPKESAALASQTGGLLELMGRAVTADSSKHAYEDKALQLLFAVFTALMTGEVTLARRMTTGNVPPLLDAERVRIHLLHCPPADRDRLVRSLDSSGFHGRGLMVQCPAFDEQLICLAPESAEPGGRSPQGEMLRRLVRETPGYALGISRPHPLAETRSAYGEAVHALAVARNSPDRVAVHQRQSSLVEVLPRGAGLAWARALTGPLSGLPKPTVDVSRLVVAFPRTATARLLSISRTTVAAHCRKAEAALRVNLGDIRTRAALDLALSLTGLEPDPAVAVAQVPPSLDELLRSDAAVSWADIFLLPLREARYREVYATVAAWIDANTDAQRTSVRLGLSRNTVRARLRTAERLLKRDLLTTGTGIHDVVHALAVAELSDSASSDVAAGLLVG
ncbi:PucR family transcriptional regulator [Streptomyces resistomycificus]|uniref:PucR family transcriptional regulator n=1 Tax=Streptomyces resistomycificus TaxID=67356 RepID=UPI00069106B8|nr:PucR family transcriptional regulator [Streptomyces resistomycificus]